MLRKKRILILSFSYLDRDPRVRRQMDALKEYGYVSAAGYSDPDIPEIRYIQLPEECIGLFEKMVLAVLLMFRVYELAYWIRSRVRQGVSALKDEDFDLVLANDVNALPMAMRLAGHRPVIFDAHEFSPGEFNDKWLFRWLMRPYRQYLSRKYIPRAADFTTVAEGISKLYQKATGVAAQVIPNAAEYVELEPRLLSSDDSVRLIHHGGACASRQLELMIEMMDYLDENFSLTLMLVDVTPGYIQKLRKYAAGRRVEFIDPVPFSEIVPVISEYDMGIFLLPPFSPNARFALPNKIFEFVQARLGICVGPSPEMAELVNKYSLGVVSEEMTAQSMAEKLSAMTTDELNQYKSNSDRFARELSFEDGAIKLQEMVQAALSETGVNECAA